MLHDDWRQIPWDPETLALRRLSASAVDILNGPSSPSEKPYWVENFKKDNPEEQQEIAPPKSSLPCLDRTPEVGPGLGSVLGAAR